MTYYVAATVDGCIAGPDGDIDWLMPFLTEDEDYGFGPFFDGIETLVMGRATWDFVASQPEWPYGDRAVIVMTHRELVVERENVHQYSGSAADALQHHGVTDLEKVWLVGGGGLAMQCLSEGLITKIKLALIPHVLGDGGRLFSSSTLDGTQLKLQDAITYPSGLIALTYHIPQGE